jgi:hypothetical protein
MTIKKIIEHKKSKKKAKTIKRVAEQEQSDDFIKTNSENNTVIIVHEDGTVTIEQKLEKI